MNKYFYKLNILFVVTILVTMCYANVTFAGNINSDEARVIGVASGTFTYKGKTYKAHSSYINELYSYLNDDGTDLSKDQADSAISYIYSNVKEGIDSGYVYEVKSPEDNNVDLDKVSTPDTSSQAAKETAKEASDKEVSEMLDEIDKNYKERQKYSNNSASATATDASIYVNDDSIMVSTDNGDYQFFKNDRIVPRAYTYLISILGISLIVINILVFIFLYFSKCMRFKSQERKKPRKGHHKRRRIRKICRTILTVTSAIAISLICFIIAFSIGFFNNNRIMTNIQNSGYFRYAYTRYIGETTERTYDMFTEAATETATEAPSEVLSYDEYIVKEKVSINSTFGKGYDTNQEISDDSIAPYIKRIQLDVTDSIIIGFICSLLAFIIAVICNIFMDLRRDRGVMSISVSTFIGAAVTFAFAILLSVFRIDRLFSVEPGYLFNFLQDQMDYIIKIFIIIGLLCVVIGLSLVGLYKSMRRDR